MFKLKLRVSTNPVGRIDVKQTKYKENNIYNSPLYLRLKD